MSDADKSAEREEFCYELAPHLVEALETLGIEDADMGDGVMLADTVYCLGYRVVVKK